MMNKKLILGLVLIGGLQTTRPSNAVEAVTEGTLSAAANAAVGFVQKSAVIAAETGGKYLAGAAIGGATVFTRHYLLGLDHKDAIATLETEIKRLNEQVIADKDLQITDLEDEIATLKTEIKRLNEQVIAGKDLQITHLENEIASLKNQLEIEKLHTLNLKENQQQLEDHIRTHEEFIAMLKDSLTKIQAVATEATFARKEAEKRADLAETKTQKVLEEADAMKQIFDKMMAQIGFKQNDIDPSIVVKYDSDGDIENKFKFAPDAPIVDETSKEDGSAPNKDAASGGSKE